MLLVLPILAISRRPSPIGEIKPWLRWESWEIWVKLSEIEERIAEIRTEFGNSDSVIPDQLEPGWINSITSIEYDHDRDVTVFSTD